MKWLKLNRSKIKVSGKKSKFALKGIQEEHKIFLHNLLTNDINNLPAGKFNYNLRLKENGHPIQDFFVYNFGDYFILDTQEDAKKVIDEFNRLKLSLQVNFEDLTDKMNHIYVYGDGAKEFIESILEKDLEDFNFVEKDGAIFAKNFLRVGEEGYDIFGDTREVLNHLNPEDQIDETEFEKDRIKNCVPKIGKELKEGYLPLETPIADYAISYNKGCYVGQEAIARVYFRGKTPRTLVKLKLADNSIQEGEKLFADERKVGEITSLSPDKDIALGYVLRAFLDKPIKTETGKEIVPLGECKVGEKSTK